VIDDTWPDEEAEFEDEDLAVRPPGRFTIGRPA
jgi:hypothetical protein